ncbi:MAG: tRNA lysidine(34) synthetase TilS [Gemmatimonadaceae bacterium]
MPPAGTSVERALHSWLREGAGDDAPLLLAVSGGLDSVVLLDALARVAPGRIAGVATFDHGTGTSARLAVAHVAREAAARRLPLVTGTARGPLAGEAAWRRARWRFLGEALQSMQRATGRPGLRIATAHTRDDQVETVLMRALRGAGARGLAGLAAESGVARPLLGVSRAEVRAHAGARALRWVEDPSNTDRAFLRNRVRHDILPALVRHHPTLPDALHAIGERAARWRREMDELARRLAPPLAPAAAASTRVAAADLAGYDSAGLAILWSAIAWRTGLALDRRGTRRLVEFTMTGRGDAVAPLAGGWEVARIGARYELRRAVVHPEGAVALPTEGSLHWGCWRFSAAPGEQPGDDPWAVILPEGPLAVRGWRPGDRVTGAGGRPRRVKRFLSDAGVRGADRTGWPVVVAGSGTEGGEKILWIPGIRRSDAATAPSGRPALTFRCERTC